MAMEVAMEDDVFFADLNRQISMLIDDEDDDDVRHVSRLSSFSPQEFPRMVVGRHPAILASQYEIYQGTNNRAIAREMSKGTGVFIPQSTHPRRRSYKQQQQQRQQGGTNKNKQFTNNPRARSNINNINNNTINNNNINNDVASHTNFSPGYPPTSLYNGYEY